jgi:hypothetical protein
MLSSVAEAFSIWFVAALIGAASFAAFATGQKKLVEQRVDRHRRS